MPTPANSVKSKWQAAKTEQSLQQWAREASKDDADVEKWAARKGIK